MRCLSYTKAGNQCKNQRSTNSDRDHRFCHIHQKCKRWITEQVTPKILIKKTKVLPKIIFKKAKGSDNDKQLDVYKEYWQELYGIPKGLPPIQEMRREREVKFTKERLRQKYQDPERFEHLQAKKIQHMYRKYISCKPCDNQYSGPDDHLVTIGLRICDPNTKQTYCVSYNVIDLYNELTTLYGNDTSKWDDPWTKLLYTLEQSKRIKKIWSRVRQGPARIRLERSLEMSYTHIKQTQPTSPTSPTSAKIAWSTKT